jgi:hypothetical protein
MEAADWEHTLTDKQRSDMPRNEAKEQRIDQILDFHLNATSNEKKASDYVKNLLSYHDMSHDERINLRGHLANILNLQEDYICECEIGKSVASHHANCPHMIETFGEPSPEEQKYKDLEFKVAEMLTNNRDRDVPWNPHQLLNQWDKIRD